MRESNKPKIAGGALRTRDNPRMWHLEVRKDDVANSLTGVEKDSLVVFTPPNLTSTHPQSTATSGKPVTSYTKEMSVNKKPKKSPTLTYSPLDSRASLSQLLGEDVDLKMIGVY